MVAEAGKGELAQPGVRRILRDQGGGIRIVDVGKDERRKLLAAPNLQQEPTFPPEPTTDEMVVGEISQELHKEVSATGIEGSVRPDQQEILHRPNKGYAGRQPTWDEIFINNLLTRFPFLRRFVPEKEET